MNETEIKVIETLSREIGNSVSISDLAKKIQKNYGNSDYKNIHKAVQVNTEKNITKIEKKGNTVNVKLNFENYLIVDFLTEIELIKKIKFLEKYKKFQIIFSELISHAKEFKQLKTLSILDPDQNAESNKIELLMIVNGKEIKKETKKIKKILLELKKKHNVEIISLIIENNAFINHLRDQEKNTMKEFFKNKIILFGSETLWVEIKECITQGFNIKSEEQIDLNNILESEMIFNLTRFGYTEFTNENKQEEHIGLEYVITIILLNRKYQKYDKAVTTVILKNEDKINYNLLNYLAIKYKVEIKLSNNLKIINSMKPNRRISNAIKNLPIKK